MNKKIMIVAGGITFVLLVIVTIRLVMGKNEDTWICGSNGWIKHGRPDEPMPTDPCGTPTAPSFKQLPFEPKKTDVPDEQYITVIYQPMQCESTPWDVWYKKGEIKFFKEPSDEDIITMYYSVKQKLYIQNVKRINLNERVCQACSICPRSYFFTAEIAPSDLEKIKSLGWKTNE